MTQTMKGVSTILMVDDNPTNLQVLYGTLEDPDRRLLAARSGEEALQIANSGRPDLILLDIMMPPGIDGYETLRRLKADEELRDIPVIFLSSLDDTDAKVRGLKYGAVDYISKPFQAEEVIARVNTHLTIRCLQTDLAERNAQLAAANQRMKTDLEAAARVQQALLPTSLPICEGFEFGWAYKPCHELGGDSLDIFQIDDNTIGFYLLDVSGHGVPASLLAITATRSLSPRSDRSSIVTEQGWEPGSSRVVPPGEVLRRLNVLNPMEGERNPHFITMIYATLDVRSGVVRYACAGHPGPILMRENGAIETLDGGSLPLGLSHETAYETATLNLESGDRLFLHSDGLNEQLNRSGVEFGRDRLRHELAADTGCVTKAIDGAMDAVQAWADDVVLSDDLSLLGVMRVGSK